MIRKCNQAARFDVAMLDDGSDGEMKMSHPIAYISRFKVIADSSSAPISEAHRQTAL